MPFSRLAGFIDHMTNLIYEDLIYTQNLNVKYVKIAMVFFDEEENRAKNYFFEKDRVKKMSQKSYQEHILKKITEFLNQKVEINIKTFDVSIMYTL
jgi:hypothetical protein